MVSRGEGCGWNLNHNGVDAGQLCAFEPSHVLPVRTGESYKLRIRQTKTQNKTTTIVIWRDHTNWDDIWRWQSTNGHKPRYTVFLDYITDEFLTKTFGDGTVNLRIHVEKVA